jgi:hypothetical protein
MNKMINPTDDQLDAAFAERVAGWWHADSHTETNPAWNTGDGWTFHNGNGNFTQSADAVLPWLEKAGRWNVFRDDGFYEIELEDKPMPDDGNWFAFDKSFSRAAVIALLRAHGVEVEFTEAAK